MRKARKIWPFRLWVELFRARRYARRLSRKFRQLERSHLEDTSSLTARYEEELALQRSRYDQMQTELTSRILQAVKLQPVLITDLEQGITNPKFRQKPVDGDVEDLLSGPQLERFEAEKERFFSEGIDMGLSPAEIKERWNNTAKEAVLEDML